MCCVKVACSLEFFIGRCPHVILPFTSNADKKNVGQDATIRCPDRLFTNLAFSKSCILIAWRYFYSANILSLLVFFSFSIKNSPASNLSLRFHNVLNREYETGMHHISSHQKCCRFPLVEWVMLAY